MTNSLVNVNGVATVSVTSGANEIFVVDDGPCLQGTVQALIDDEGDAKMSPQQRSTAVSEAKRFATSILTAYISHFRTSSSGQAGGGAEPSAVSPSGLLYGCVQSGKTRAITLTSAMLFDNGIKVVVVLTSNNVELVEQTVARLQLVSDVQFLSSLSHDKERWDRDARHIATHIERTGLLVVCQKERNHQKKLVSFLREINAGNLPAVIFDDEADQATPDTTIAARSTGRPNAPQFGSTTYRNTVQNDNPAEMGESLVETLSRSVFVQVTATPYALLLQRTDHPLRPKFTDLIEPGEGYMGGDWFFPQHLITRGVKAPVVEVPATEANALVAGQLQAAPEMLRRSIAYFCLAAAANEIHSKHKNKFGYSFLCHTSSKKVDHAHLERLVSLFLDQVSKDLERDVSGDVSNAFAWAIDELKLSAPEVLTGLSYASLKGWILKKLPLRAIRVINAESDSLNFTPGLNFLIGGNILGRGLTIKRLLVTYYMRSARSTQMDTMLQHARMFGYRQEHKNLIRVFLPRTSINRFVEIVQAEKELRSLIKDGGIGAIPVRVAQSLNATRRNILDTGSLDAYRGGSQIYPYEPEFDPIVLNGLTDRLKALMMQGAFKGDLRPRVEVEISWALFEDLVKSVRLRETDDSRWLPSAIVNVSHTLQKLDDGSAAPLPLLWYRETTRKGPRFETGVAGGDDPGQGDPKFVNRLVLMMFLHNGEGFGGHSFWVPTVYLPRRLGAYLFSSTE